MKNYKKYKLMIIVLMAFAILQAGLFNTIISYAKENETLKVAENTQLADGTYYIKSVINTNYVLDITGGSTINGANLELYRLNNSNAQKFIVKSVGNNYYTITSVGSNKVLDVAGAGKANGTNVQQYQSNNTDAQKWLIKDVGNGYYSIISKCNNLYLDVAGGLAQNGRNVQVYAGNNSAAQKFKFEAVSTNNNNNSQPTVQGTQTIGDGTYTVRSAVSNSYVLDINGGSTINGANLQIYQANNSNAQKVTAKYLGDGTYSLTAVHSGKVFDVASGAKTNGTNVQQYQSNNTDAQKWIIKDAGNGYYYIISKCNNLYLDIAGGIAQNGRNVQVYAGNSSAAQKFKFESTTINNNTTPNTGATQNNNVTSGPVKDGTYSIECAISSNFVLDVNGGFKSDGANVQIYQKQAANRQKFSVKSIGNGYYTITAIHSNKVLDVAGGAKTNCTNVQQFQSNGSDAQKWLIKEAGGGYYYIISKCNNLYLDIAGGLAQNGRNVQVYAGNGSAAQKFKFVQPLEILNTIDTAKYPGYKEKIAALMNAHPGWNFELLYTGLRFDQVIAGEAALHSRNLVPTNYKGEWICSACGTKLYDSGWYCASQKATAYYMDPRNFLNDANIFQFQDVNEYIEGVCTLQGIQTKVNGTFLQAYASAIDNACRNQNVNPYYIIARVLQEQGSKGTTIGTGMNGGNGKTYYNPFNIGASGNGSSQIYANALATAKSYGWDSMQKALEGGITFCKKNWLENYQNTLYQNKFDIDNRSGGGLYTHQYMQNLMAAQSESSILRTMYANTGKIDSNFTFIIPMYEGMTGTGSPQPSNNQEVSPINVKVTATSGVWLRESADANSAQIRLIPSGEVILSVQRGINSNWHRVVMQDGKVGYVSGDYLTQVADVTNCNYVARVKTADGIGCNVRVGPGVNLDLLTAIAENATVTVINDTIYKGIDGYDWYRVILSNGQQGFMPSKFLVR